MATPAELMAQLAQAPVVDLRGVTVNGAAATREGEAHWLLLASLQAWRSGDDPVRTEKLVLRKVVDDAGFERLSRALTPYRVLHLRARVVEDSVFGTPQALLEEVVGSDDDDAALRAEVERLQQPVTHADPLLGVFTLDRRISWFTAQATWNGQAIELSLDASEPDDIAAALRTAHALWADGTGWERRIRGYAVEQLLPLKNEHWLAEDEAELSGEAFQARMRLRSIVIEPDGGFEFWHDDGDLFWGHSIQVRGSLADGPIRADIPG